MNLFLILLIINIIKYFKGKRGVQLGGLDVNKEAIDLCNEMMPRSLFRQMTGDKIFMGDKSTDVILTDMTLIYVAPIKIKKYLKEIKRVTRKYIVIHEFHEKNWFKRQWLRIRSGRHSYNYEKLLTKLEFFDINIIKMPNFDNDNQNRYLIVAKP